ncbi:hypothetical protein FKM82_000133 [Ascaphus truei]
MEEDTGMLSPQLEEIVSTSLSVDAVVKCRATDEKYNRQIYEPIPCHPTLSTISSWGSAEEVSSSTSSKVEFTNIYSCTLMEEEEKEEEMKEEEEVSFDLEEEKVVEAVEEDAEEEEAEEEEETAAKVEETAKVEDEVEEAGRVSPLRRAPHHLRAVIRRAAPEAAIEQRAPRRRR